MRILRRAWELQQTGALEKEPWMLGEGVWLLSNEQWGTVRVLSKVQTWSVLCVRCWFQCSKWFGSGETIARESSEGVVS